MRLTRTDYLSTGIFSIMKDIGETVIFNCLEHAYSAVPVLSSLGTAYLPKIPVGAYKCVKGQHILEGMKMPFITYEITGVPGHVGLLFHKGNLDKDTAGCILLGMTRDGDEIFNSKEAFDLFMTLQNGLDVFTLLVE